MHPGVATVLGPLVKVHTLRSESPPQKRSGMARVLKGSHSFTLHTHTFVRNWNERYLPLPSQPQLVRTHLPTPEGWKAE